MPRPRLSQKQINLLRARLGPAIGEGDRLVDSNDSARLETWRAEASSILLLSGASDLFRAFDAQRGPARQSPAATGTAQVAEQVAVLRALFRRLNLESGFTAAASLVKPDARPKPVERLPNANFAFMRDPRLRRIAERDYAELRAILQSARATKAVCVLAGAVCEALLLDRLLPEGDEAELLRETIGGLLKRTREADLLPAKLRGIAGSIRDFRNLAHPGDELRTGQLASTDASLALALMQALLHERAAIASKRVD